MSEIVNPNKTLSLSIMSGKGGVGKTNLTLNLGYALREAGLTALLMDCDLGLANMDVLLGITPERNLQDLLTSKLDTKDVVVPLEKGLDVLPAASGVPELVEMDEDMQNVLFKKILGLAGGYQALILDLGAGISKTVLSFASMTQLRMIIVTPEPTSLTDSYAMIKVLTTKHQVQDFLVVVNQAAGKKEADATFERLAGACRNFLGIEIRNLGFVRHDSAVTKAVRKQTPFLQYDRKCKASQDILAISQRFLRYRLDNQAALGTRPVLKNFPSLH